MNALIQFIWIVPDVLLTEVYHIFFFVRTWILQLKFPLPVQENAPYAILT